MTQSIHSRPSMSCTVDEGVGEPTAKKHRSFPHTAASITLLVPFITVLIGFSMRFVYASSFNPAGQPMPPDILRLIIGVDTALALLGLICAMAALGGGCPIRGVIGLLLNGLQMLGAIFLIYFTPVLVANLKMVGNWSSPRENMSLHADQSAEITLAGGKHGTIKGIWVIMPAATGGDNLNFIFNPATEGAKPIVWPIISSSDLQFTLSDNGHLEFHRALTTPPAP